MQPTNYKRSEILRAPSLDPFNRRFETAFDHFTDEVDRECWFAARAASELRDRIEVWVNEGGAEAGVLR